MYKSDRVNPAFLAKQQVAAGIGCVNLLDTQLACGLLDSGNSQQVFRAIGQQTKAIDEFDLQLAQLLRGFGSRDTLVQDQPQVHVRHVVFRQ